MKVNLLEDSANAFSDTIEAQINFVLKIPDNIFQQNQSYPANRLQGIKKEKILSNLKAHSEDAESLWYKVKQIKEVLPQMKPHNINRMQADYREQRSVFLILWGLLGTYQGIMTERKYEKMKIRLESTTGLVNQIANFIINRGKTIETNWQELAQIWGQIIFDTLIALRG